MHLRPERNLRSSPVFAEDIDYREHRDNIPELSDDSPLLSDAIGDEDLIFPLEAWVKSDLEWIGYFALYYWKRARDLVRVSTQSELGAENYAYVVGFLYRHAIELFMKSLIGTEPSFKKLEPSKQRARIQGHPLLKLWKHARPIVARLQDESSIKRADRLLRELNKLDRGSDAFRYAFKISPEGERKPAAAGLKYASFPQFVWKLDALCRFFSESDEAQAHRGQAP